MEINRKFGLIRVPEVCAWLFLRRRWRSPELMIGGIGITFRLMNLGILFCTLCFKFNSVSLNNLYWDT